ncbi:hypothetical protein ACNKHU_23125 [Shigella flexneri]
MSYLLPAYPKELNSTQPFQLLETHRSLFSAQSGLTGRVMARITRLTARVRCITLKRRLCAG